MNRYSSSLIAAASVASAIIAAPAYAATTIVPQDNTSPGPTLTFTDGSATATFGASYTVDNTQFTDAFFFSLGQAATLSSGSFVTTAGGSAAPYKGDLDLSFVHLMSGATTLITFEKTTSPSGTDKNEQFNVPSASSTQLFAPGSYSINVSGFADNVSRSSAGGGAGPGTYSGSLVFAAAPDAVGAVPEPSTWAMMLFGFGAVGFAMRRRKDTLATKRLRVSYS
jgi:hypothetical protein